MRFKQPIALLRGAGLRRAELMKLALTNFHHGQINIPSQEARVDRTVYLSESAIAIINDWIEIRTPRDGPLL
ncbi:integrase family protein (plasmid) [Nostoc sp. HK-01]|nr:integrase family protein [Nostoc sp. HK-01]